MSKSERLKTKVNQGERQRRQPRKDSKSKRFNEDNVRASKLSPELRKLLERQDSNDIAWYTKNKSLFEASTRVTWATIQGLTKPFPDTNVTQRIPGAVMAINYAPNFLNNPSIVMQAWIAQYSEIVHANSRNQTYDSTDLAILSYAGIEVFSAIMMGVRAYGVMRDYTAESYLKPERFLNAMHFDYEDLKKNYSHMWQDLDQLIVQSRQIWIPNKMPIIQRRMWMNSYIYTDADNNHGDYYLYVPAVLYKYNSKHNDKGGGLEIIREWTVTSPNVGTTTQIPNGVGMKWQDYINMVQSMIDALLPDQDRGIIYGDILKCYGREGIFALNQIDLNYSTIPTYNKEVLWQIENSTAFNAYPVFLEQTADGNLVQQWSKMINSGIGDEGIESFILNFHQQEQPTSEQLAIATRMTAGQSSPKSNIWYYSSSGQWVNNNSNYTGSYPLCCGTEYPVFYSLHYNQCNESTNAIVKQFRFTFSTLSSDFATVSSNERDRIAYLLFLLVQLDWCPLMYNGALVGGVWKNTNIYGELDNWSPVNAETIARIHSALTNSLYDIPTM